MHFLKHGKNFIFKAIFILAVFNCFDVAPIKSKTAVLSGSSKQQPNQPFRSRNLSKKDVPKKQNGQILRNKLPIDKNQQPKSLNQNHINQKHVNQKQLWSSVQHRIQDSVVQVFSQVTEFNWLEPYKTPVQAEGTGTAFFINADGELITNSHVVNQARIVFIQIPSIGKHRYVVDIVGISPERDLALLRLKPPELEAVKKKLKTNMISYLKFGDSDSISRANKVMALGYPLGQESLKSTTGVVSGRQHIPELGQYFIQISAPLNKGNSGGPSLDRDGLVIGVNSSLARDAQNIGYIIPINEVKLFLKQLRNLPASPLPKLLRKPFLGVLFNNANVNLAKFLGNPEPGGLYVVEIYKGSPLHKAGIKAGDMIYKINGLSVDVYGEMNVPWSREDKVSIIDYISRLKIGQKINIEYYRNGSKKTNSFIFSQTERPPIRRMYPGYEKIEYESIGGLIIMPLSLNHLVLLAAQAPELLKYADLKKHMEPALIVAHVQLNSPASGTRCIGAGSVISAINGEKVKTMEQFKKAITKSLKTGYLTIKTTESIFLVIPLKEIIENERRLSSIYFFPLSQTYLDLEKKYLEQNKLENNIKELINEKLYNKMVY